MLVYMVHDQANCLYRNDHVGSFFTRNKKGSNQRPQKIICEFFLNSLRFAPGCGFKRVVTKWLQLVHLVDQLAEIWRNFSQILAVWPI